MDRLTIAKVDPELKRRFKAYCIVNKTTMQKTIISFMEKTLERDAKRNR